MYWEGCGSLPGPAPGVPRLPPPTPPPACPSSQSRKRQGHIGILQIRRCPNKDCSGGGSFLLLIWRFRVGPFPPPPLPHRRGFPGGSPNARGSPGRPHEEGAGEESRGCGDSKGPRARAGEAQAWRGGEGESGRGSTAVIPGSPALLGDRGSEPERGGAVKAAQRGGALTRASGDGGVTFRPSPG